MGHNSYNVPFELVLTPDAGYEVRLNSFMFGTWSAGSYQTQIRVWDDLGSLSSPNLLDLDELLLHNVTYGTGFLGSRPTHDSVHLYLSNLGSVGIDNLGFSQSASNVPEPHTLALAALGLLGLTSGRQRRRGV